MRTQQAVLFNFVILGEAANKLTEGYAHFLASHPQIPWRSIRNMRNQVAHGDFQVDIEVVWRTVNQALPVLLHQLPAVIAAADRETPAPDEEPGKGDR